MLNWIKKMFQTKKPIEIKPPAETSDKEDLLSHALKTQDILKESMPRAKAEEILQDELVSMIRAKKSKLGSARIIRGEEDHNKKYRGVC